MKTRSKIRIPMPARYVINLALVVGFYFLLTGLISSGVITNYWTGILITVDDCIGHKAVQICAVICHFLDDARREIHELVLCR